jgi:hypothetical protein
MLMGLAPVGVDIKGSPALLPCRLRVVWEKDEGRAKSIRETEAAHPSREDRHRRDPAGLYSAAQPFWAHISDARCGASGWTCADVDMAASAARLPASVETPGSRVEYRGVLKRTGRL